MTKLFSRINRTMRRCLLWSIAVFVGGCAPSARLPAGELVPRESDAYHHLIYLPPDYHADASPRPLLLFLHGAGERGDDLDLVKVHGPPKHIAQGDAFPFIVVAPQQPPESWWDVERLSRLLDEVEAAYRVDPARIYVTGLSMGGFGTWALGIAEPERFAALAPICGGGDPEAVCALRDVPVWNFHGANDQVIVLEASEVMVDALEACGGEVRFTIYPEVGHDAWTETYANPALYDWLLEHQR